MYDHYTDGLLNVLSLSCIVLNISCFCHSGLSIGRNPVGTFPYITSATTSPSGHVPGAVRSACYNTLTKITCMIKYYQKMIGYLLGYLQVDYYCKLETDELPDFIILE